MQKAWTPSKPTEGLSLLDVIIYAWHRGSSLRRAQTTAAVDASIHNDRLWCQLYLHESNLCQFFPRVGTPKTVSQTHISLHRRMPQPSRYRLYCGQIEVRGCPPAFKLLLSRVKIHSIRRKQLSKVKTLVLQQGQTLLHIKSCNLQKGDTVFICRSKNLLLVQLTV